jgi:hypothetical protein
MVFRSDSCICIERYLFYAAHEYDARRRMISKSYYQQLRSSERQALVSTAGIIPLRPHAGVN